MEGMTAAEVELAVANWIGTREHLCVPNVSWGMHLHECDLLYLSDKGFATEIEIKVTKSDLKRDAQKRHQHRSPRIKFLYYAMPITMADCAELVPEHAGILLASRRQPLTWEREPGRMRLECKVTREPETNRAAAAFTDTERLQLARLGALRIWTLKKRILELEGRSLADACTDYSI